MNEMVIEKRMVDFIASTHHVINRLPKHEQLSLGSQIRNCQCEIMRLCVSVRRKHHKKTTARDLDIEMDLLRHLYRLCFSLRYINVDRYEAVSIKLSEIGRMVGGLIKSIRD